MAVYQIKIPGSNVYQRIQSGDAMADRQIKAAYDKGELQDAQGREILGLDFNGQPTANPQLVNTYASGKSDPRQAANVTQLQPSGPVNPFDQQPIKYDASGRPIYPGAYNLLTPEGTLKEPYNLKAKPDVEFASNMEELQNQLSGINLNKDALEELRRRSTEVGPSQQAKYLTEAQQLGELQGLGSAGASSRQATSTAFSDLASRGGLSSGARERLASQGARGLASSMQDVRATGQQQRLGILASDEANKQAILSSLPGMEIQALQPEFQKTSAWQQLAESEAGRRQNLDLANRTYGSEVEKLNIGNTLGQIGSQDAARLAAYQEAMKGYAGEQSGKAISAGGGGKK